MEGRRIYVKHPSYLKNELFHHGVKNQRWGERRWQYEDGSLTPEGRIHYGVGPAKGESVDRKYTKNDGSLNLRGKIHYRTLHGNSSLSDEEIQSKTKRLQSEKNLEDLKKQTSATYRLKNKIGNALEEVAVSGIRKMSEKLINNFIDKSVSKILGTEKENVERARKFAETVKDMSIKEMNSRKTRAEAENKLYKELYGTDLPKDYNRTDLTEKEKEGVKKAENEGQTNTNQPSQSSEKKKEGKQTSEKKQESSKPKEEVAKSSEKKSESKGDNMEKTKNESYANIKSPVMKELQDKPLMNKKQSFMSEISEKKQTPPLSRQRMVPEELTKPYTNVKSPAMKELRDKPLVRIHRVNLDEDDKKKKKG